MPEDIPAEHIAVYVHAAHVVYNGATLFDDLDFTLPAGQWTSLLGPSGVGKTTLLRLIAGLMENGTDSTVRCDDGAPVMRRVAYMAQQDLLLPWLSALGNVLLGARLRRHAGRFERERARHLLERVGLGDRSASLPSQLSGGQRQRVALARTLFEDRPIVLMDEPFSSLDALTRFRLQDLAVELLHGRTVLLVTHDPLEALRLSDRIHVMAGQPARLTAAAAPPGRPPRRLDDPEILALQADLLGRFDPADIDLA
jgi:putative hydroxymethylpyrimidine transport system ATP-binding protein